MIAHHEPVFLEGLGSEPLFAFVEQYVGLSARQPIRVGRPNARAAGASPATTVDGISMATASTRVINETMLAASLAVAREKLGFGAVNTGLRVEAKPDYEPLGLAELERRGWVQRWRMTPAEVDAAFAGTGLADPDPGAPDEPFSDLTIAYLNVPAIGRAILGEAAYGRLMREIGPGAHAVMVVSSGHWSPLPDDFVLGSVPDRLTIQQGGLTVNARDAAWERRDLAPDLPAGPWTLLKIGDAAGFDPSAPWSLSVKVTRERGRFFRKRSPARSPPNTACRRTCSPARSRTTARAGSIPGTRAPPNSGSSRRLSPCSCRCSPGTTRWWRSPARSRCSASASSPSPSASSAGPRRRSSPSSPSSVWCAR